MPSETLNTGFRRHLFTVELSPSGGEVFQRRMLSALQTHSSLNPHVVGRFFREVQYEAEVDAYVLIPMWWGGFSEMLMRSILLYRKSVLIPMWWGGFSEAIEQWEKTASKCLNPHVVGRFFRARNGFLKS